MAEDPDRAQARMLVGLLHEEIARISDRLEAAERDVPLPSQHGHGRRVRHAARLRRQLRELQLLIDRLHRRFPETRDAERPESDGWMTSAVSSQRHSTHPYTRRRDCDVDDGVADRKGHQPRRR
jgi:hypothetical protein